MQTINFKMKEHEAEWKETRRQIKNDLDYEVKQAQRECADRIEKAQRECADRIEKAQRECADRIEKAQRRHYERCKEIAIEEDTYKAQATEARNATRAQVLAELERIDELKAKHGLNGEGGEQ